MMNPFDLPGREFLLFYFLFATAVIGLAALVRWRVEAGPIPRLTTVDPYLIAALRGGNVEAIKVATLSLLDRGLLTAANGMLSAPPEGAGDVRRALERAI